MLEPVQEPAVVVMPKDIDFGSVYWASVLANQYLASNGQFPVNINEQSSHINIKIVEIQLTR